VCGGGRAAPPRRLHGGGERGPRAWGDKRARV
jgi:hypothetical protein